MGRVEGVLLDAAWTLFGLTYRRPERFRRFLAAKGYFPSADVVLRVLAAADAEFSYPDLPHVRTREEESEVWLAYCRRVLGELDVPIHSALIDEALWECSYLSCLYLYPDVLRSLRLWRGRVRLGLVSNAEPSFREALETLRLLSYFDDVILSFEVGLRKPDPVIYRLALRNLDLPAESTLFVDDLPENVRGAMALGIRGYWIRRDGEPESDSDLPTIRSLEDLVALGVGQ